MSTVARPVTVTAEVDVKNAAMKLARPPDRCSSDRQQQAEGAHDDQRSERQRQQTYGVGDRGWDLQPQRAEHGTTLPQGRRASPCKFVAMVSPVRTAQAAFNRLGRTDELPGFVLTVGRLFLAIACAVAGLEIGTIVLLLVSVGGEVVFEQRSSSASELFDQGRSASRCDLPCVSSRAGRRSRPDRRHRCVARVHPRRRRVRAAALRPRPAPGVPLVGPLKPMETRNIPGAPRIYRRAAPSHGRGRRHPAAGAGPGAPRRDWWVVPAARARRPWRCWRRDDPRRGPRGSCVSPNARPASPVHFARSRTSSTTYEPEVVVHLSGPETAAYQINTWLESLESLDRRVFIVIRDHALFTKMGVDHDPVARAAGRRRAADAGLLVGQGRALSVQHRQQHPPAATADPDERVHRPRRQRQERLQQPVLPRVRRAVGGGRCRRRPLPPFRTRRPRGPVPRRRPPTGARDHARATARRRSGADRALCADLGGRQPRAGVLLRRGRGRARSSSHCWPPIHPYESCSRRTRSPVSATRSTAPISPASPTSSTRRHRVRASTTASSRVDRSTSGSTARRRWSPTSPAWSATSSPARSRTRCSTTPSSTTMRSARPTRRPAPARSSVATDAASPSSSTS